jgi:multiple sugar transport system substrate-binding protein
MSARSTSSVRLLFESIQRGSLADTSKQDNPQKIFTMTLRIPWTLFAGIAVVAAAISSEFVVQHQPRKDRVVITYWEKWGGFEGDAMRVVVDEFNRSQNRIWVDYLTISAVNVKTLLATAAGVPPDVAGVFDSDVVPFAEDRAAMPLETYARAAGIKSSDYIPAYWQFCVHRGHLYAMPTAPASTGLHYNTDYFRQAGLDPAKPPETLEEMSAMVDKLTKKDKDGKLVRAGFVPAEPDWWRWGWGYIFGGRLWDGESKITANSPENVHAFEWVASFSKRYGPTEIFTFRSGFGNFNSPENAFMAGKVAMVMQGVWMANFIEKNNPKLHWAAAPFPHPANRPDLANSTFVGLDVLIIPRGAKHPDEAFEFIKYVQSQKPMELFCLGQRKHSPLMKASKDFLENHPNPFIRLFTDLPKGKNVFRSPPLGIWPEYQMELNSAFDDIYLLQKTPKQALDLVQARMQPKLDRYLKTLKERERAGALDPPGAEGALP